MNNNPYYYSLCDQWTDDVKSAASLQVKRSYFFPREPLDQLEITALTECKLKLFSWILRAGAPSPLSYLPLALPFFLVPTTSKRLLRRLKAKVLSPQL